MFRATWATVTPNQVRNMFSWNIMIFIICKMVIIINKNVAHHGFTYIFNSSFFGLTCYVQDLISYLETIGELIYISEQKEMKDRSDSHTHLDNFNNCSLIRTPVIGA